MSFYSACKNRLVVNICFHHFKTERFETSTLKLRLRGERATRMTSAQCGLNVSIWAAISAEHTLIYFEIFQGCQISKKIEMAYSCWKDAIKRELVGKQDLFINVPESQLQVRSRKMYCFEMMKGIIDDQYIVRHCKMPGMRQYFNDI